MENSSFGPQNQTSSGSTKWIIIGLVLLLGLGAVLYYFGAGDLFKGQAKLDAQKKSCEKIIAENKPSKSVARCLKAFPDSKAGETKTIQYGFDNKPFKIVQILPAPKPINPEQSMNITSGGMENPQSIVPEIYYDKMDNGFTASVGYVLPSYNDGNLPPQISLPVGLELCTSSNKCTVLQQSTLTLIGENNVNSGNMTFSRSALAETVDFLGLNSGDNVKFRLSIKESPNNTTIYTDYSEAKVLKVSAK